MRLILAAALLTAAGAAAAQEKPQMPGTGQAIPAPPKRTSFDDCMDKVKSPKDILRMELHELKPGDCQRVADDLAGVLVCDGMTARMADPCAVLKGIGKPIGSPKGVPAQSEETLIARCHQDLRFGRFYEEALRASKKQKKFPACLDYFQHIPLVTVGPGFESMCGVMSGYVQNQVQDGFCDTRMDPYVRDMKQWKVICKVIGEIYISADPRDCSFFPEPSVCAEQAAMVPSFQARRPEGCGDALGGGVCRGLLPSPDPKVSRCKVPWINLSRDYCRSLVASGVFNRAKNDGKHAEEPPAKQDEQPGADPEEAPSEER